jgi:hypothetical protein
MFAGEKSPYKINIIPIIKNCRSTMQESTILISLPAFNIIYRHRNGVRWQEKTTANQYKNKLRKLGGVGIG